MKRDTFLMSVIFITMLYIGAFALGVGLGNESTTNSAYVIYKDMLPVIFSVPLAWLVYIFEKRNNHVKAVREQYARVLKSVSRAIHFLEYDNPQRKPDEFHSIVADLSMSIDDVRGEFSNIGETKDNIGSYPLREIRDIHDVFKARGTLNDREALGKLKGDIVEKWKTARKKLLREMDRV